ncbi:MAG: hydroxyisourate hydrolase [Betaproteobacteria bacterium]|jgi:5-hydroxyisourate hydrolase
MGLSTHVLDTYHGRPAAGMAVSLYATGAGAPTLIRRVELNADGRNPDGPLISNDDLCAGTYRLVFEVAAYFRRQGVDLPEPPFLDQVPLDFGIAHASQHYHVPLVCTPWTYSTYRGS